MLGFLLVLATAPFADVLFGFHKLFIRDLTRYYYPTKRVIREVLQQGHFPFWNRYYSAGQPMAANPEYEIFYPPQWLILLPDYDVGYRLHILVHIWIAVIGMYAFLRSLRLGIRASSFGALTWALGGLVVSMINLLPILFCMVWMPLIFLFTRRFLKTGELRDFSLGALFLGIQMLTAEPTTLIQTWFLMGVYGLFHAWYASDRWKRVAINTGRVALLGIAGAMVGAAQMIPAADHAGESARARAFDWALVSAWSLHPTRPLELIFPTFFGYVDRGGSLYWASSLYKGTGSPFIFNFYLGVLVAALIAAAFAVRPRGGRAVLLVCAFSYLIAMGSHTPLLRVLYDAGIAQSIRYFEKYSLMGLLSVIVLASMMAQRCLDGDRKALRVAWWFLLVTTVIAAGLFLFSFTDFYKPAFRKVWGTGDTANGRRMISVSGMDWGWAVVRGLIALAVVDLIRHKRFGRVAAMATAVLITIDLSWVTLSTLPRMPRNFFTAPPIVERLDADQERYRLFHEADWYNGSDVAKSYFSTGDAIYWIVRNGLFPMTPATWGYRTVLERDYDKTALLPTVDLVDSMWKVRDAKQPQWADMFMSMSNARYRGFWVKLEDARKQSKGNFKKADPIDFVRQKRENPRYFFAEKLVSYKTPRDFQKLLIAAKEWTPGTVYVDAPAFAPALGKVLSYVETTNTAAIEVEASGRSFLYMSVTPHKYWRAWIDGREVPLVTANVGYQGVVVPAGRHRVTMRYRNTVVVAMAMLSAVSFVLFTLLALRRRRRPALPMGTRLEPLAVTPPEAPAATHADAATPEDRA